MEEILYQIDSLDDLCTQETSKVRWLVIPDDIIIFNEHLGHQGRTLAVEEWLAWKSDGISYCGLILHGKMVARAAVERYCDEKWETADVQVIPEVRGKGYGKHVVHFVTEYILKNGRSATCRTRVNNIPMERIILSAGFKKVSSNKIT